MRVQTSGFLVIGLMLGISGCGGDESAAAPPSEPPAGGGGAAGGGAAPGAFDPNAPEYQGDHSIPGDPEAGAEVYRANCLACHAANGQGNGGITGADLVNDPSRLSKNNETLLRSIRDGRPQANPPMPAHSELISEQEIVDALSYVRATFGHHEDEDEEEDEED